MDGPACFQGVKGRKEVARGWGWGGLIWYPDVDHRENLALGRKKNYNMGS